MKRALPVLLIAVMLSGAAVTAAGAKTRKKRAYAYKCASQCYQPYCQGAYDCGGGRKNAELFPVYKKLFEPAAIFIDGRQYAIKAILINGHTYAPLRDLFESLGAEVNHNYYTDEIVINYRNRSLVLQIGNGLGRNYNTAYSFLGAPVMVKGRAYLPLREATDFFGLDLVWNYYNHTARIAAGRYDRYPYGLGR